MISNTRIFYEPMVNCVNVMQEDIAEKYLLARLTDTEKEAYERHFLECDRCFQELENYRALRNELRRKAAATNVHSMVRPFAVPWTWTAAAAVVILVVSNSWWLVKDKRLESQLQKIQGNHVALEAHAQDLEQQLAQANRPSVAASSTTVSPQAESLLSASQQPPGMLRFTPQSITRERAQPDLLTIPSRHTVVQFELNLQPNSYRAYSVMLETADGDLILRANGLAAERNAHGGQRIRVPVPAPLLQPRDYVIAVHGITGHEQSEEIEVYSFRVRPNR